MRLPEYHVLSYGECLCDRMVNDGEPDLKLIWILYLREVLDPPGNNAHFLLGETLANGHQVGKVGGEEFLEQSQTLKDQSLTSHAFQKVAKLDAETSLKSGQ